MKTHRNTDSVRYLLDDTLYTVPACGGYVRADGEQLLGTAGATTGNTLRLMRPTGRDLAVDDLRQAVERWLPQPAEYPTDAYCSAGHLLGMGVLDRELGICERCESDLPYRVANDPR